MSNLTNTETVIIALYILERKAWWVDALQYSTHHFPGLPISQIPPSIWSMSMHAPNKTRKQKSPPWPQLLKDTVNVYVRMKETCTSAAP